MELLVGQIKPHFVFNALNVIEDICVKEPEKAKTAIKYFSTYMKANMNSLADRRVIPLKRNGTCGKLSLHRDASQRRSFKSRI